MLCTITFSSSCCFCNSVEEISAEQGLVKEVQCLFNSAPLSSNYKLSRLDCSPRIQVRHFGPCECLDCNHWPWFRMLAVFHLQCKLYPRDVLKHTGSCRSSTTAPSVYKEPSPNARDSSKNGRVSCVGRKAPSAREVLNVSRTRLQDPTHCTQWLTTAN